MTDLRHLSREEQKLLADVALLFLKTTANNLTMPCWFKTTTKSLTMRC